jgi:putative RecB family exonuclease
VERACEREDFRPNPGRLCDWCAFKAYCPAFGGNIRLADEHRARLAEAEPEAEPEPTRPAASVPLAATG